MIGLNWLGPWKPRGGRPRAVVYTRAGCHLCDDAIELLRSRGCDVRAIDIEADPELLARHGERVPVVEIDGRERFFGKIQTALLDRYLAARPRGSGGR